MKAAIAHNFGDPLSLEEVDKPVPKHDEVSIQIETAGLCHTDIHAVHGDWPAKPKMPLIPGHEGVGIVERVGSSVTNVKEGDRVALPWLAYACGSCEHCVSGRETLCHQQENAGYSIDGSYAEYARGFGKYVSKVPKGVDPIDAAPLTCAGVTTYKAVKESEARPSELVVVFGIGGLGHLAIQYAKIAGATVVAVDLVDKKLKLAKELGASYTFNPKNDDVVEELQKMGGAHAAISTAVSPKAFEQAYKSLRRGGRLVFVGLPAENHIQLPIFETVLQGLTIKGSIVGTRRDLEEVFQLHADGYTKVLRETRTLDTVNESFDDVLHSRMEQPRIVFDLRTNGAAA
ncbi:MAG: alcohol dehydrogenase AdhP [Bacteroidetes bacterium]|jgi:propanol-preferring alcohol dehydrogenase|nr:alcohol dehydrogenase AdhP [Bacteroidota bacterium]